VFVTMGPLVMFEIIYVSESKVSNLNLEDGAMEAGFFTPRSMNANPVPGARTPLKVNMILSVFVPTNPQD
jgi:hypothetical protein